MGNKKKLKKVLIIMGIISLLLVAFVLYFGKKGFTKEGRNNKVNEDNINYIYDYLSQNFSGNLPYPQGDLILLDKNGNQIYKENTNNYLGDFKDVSVIQGNTCGLDLTDQSKKYDVRFSDKNFKRCYEYAITKDKKHFQLGRVEKGFFSYEAKTKGNTKENILRDYAGEGFAKDGDSKLFPYFPDSNDKLEFKIMQGNPDVKLELDDSSFSDFSKSSLKDGIFLGGGEAVGIYMQGDNFLAKLIFPNGGYIIISPLDKKAEIYVRKTNLNENRSDIIMKNLKGIFLADFPTPYQKSDNRIYDNYGGSYILNANQTLFYSSGNVFASLVVNGGIEFIQKMQSYFFKKGFWNTTIKEEDTNIFEQGNQDILTNFFAFKIKIFGNAKNIEISDSNNLKNSMISYLSSKSIKQEKSHNISMNGNKYKMLEFNGELNKDFAKSIKDYIQKNDASNISIESLLDNACGTKNEKIGIDDFMNFFGKYDEAKKSLDFDPKFANILINKNIIIGNKSSKIWSITYRNGKSFDYIDDLTQSKKNIKDFILICNEK